MDVKPDKIKRCRCGAEIFFATTAKGKSTPLDAKPVRVALLADVAGDAPKIEDAAEGYVSHWATCKDADKFRGGK